MKSLNRLSVAIGVFALLVTGAHAQEGEQKAPPKQPPAQKKDGKLDISELEQKYWAPKDTDFSVVQNRTYTKKGKFSASLLVGSNINDVWNDGYNYSLIGSYFFNERHGIEGHYIHADLKDHRRINDFLEQLSEGGTKPDYSRTTSHYGVSYTWVPFYAKMSVLGQKIIYFDMAFSPGVGVTNYTQQTESGIPNKEKSAFTFNLDITQYFFISPHLAFRFDIRNRWFQEEVVSFTEGEKVQDKDVTLTQFVGGITYFF